MSKTSQTLTVATLTCVIFVFSTPFAVSAQNFVPLTGIPGVDVNNTDLVGYINALYILAVALGALFAVVKIGVAGTKYAMSDIVTDKESAKKDIYGALIGLAILLATYIVLYTIDPRLTSLNILGNAQPGTITTPSNATLPQNSGSAGSGGTQPTNQNPLLPSNNAVFNYTSSQTCVSDTCKAACTGTNKRLVTQQNGVAICYTTTTIEGPTDGGNIGFEPQA